MDDGVSRIWRRCGCVFDDRHSKQRNGTRRVVRARACLGLIT